MCVGCLEGKTSQVVKSESCCAVEAAETFLCLVLLSDLFGWKRSEQRESFGYVDRWARLREQDLCPSGSSAVECAACKSEGLRMHYVELSCLRGQS